MRKSGRVTIHEMKQVAALIDQCRDLGDDAVAWQQHLIDGLRRLVGAAIGAAVLLPATQPCPPGTVLPTEITGDWPSDGARDRWVAWARGGRFDEFPVAEAFFQETGPVVSRTRRELMADRDWERSAFMNERYRPDGIDEGLVARAAAPAVEAVFLLTLIRVTADPPFAEWAGRVTEYVLQGVVPHLGRALLVSTQPNRAGLPPRSLCVLDALLDGDSEKQVGLRLGIGRGTVHDHVKLLYRHFGVCSRAELLAYFLRRYRGHTGGNGERPSWQPRLEPS